MSESRVPCPFCGAPVGVTAKGCRVCGRGIAIVKLRATIQGEPKIFLQRVACDPDEVEFLDGTEAELENPEELPGAAH